VLQKPGPSGGPGPPTQHQLLESAKALLRDAAKAARHIHECRAQSQASSRITEESQGYVDGVGSYRVQEQADGAPEVSTNRLQDQSTARINVDHPAYPVRSIPAATRTWTGIDSQVQQRAVPPSMDRCSR